MNDFFSAIILGIIEGITEFLPISSTGHMIIVGQWLTLKQPFKELFEVVIQLGAILSVVLYFRDRLNPFSKNGEGNHKIEVINLWKKALVGVIPALFLGFFFGDLIQEYLFNPKTVAIALVIGGVALILIENRKREPRYNTTDELPIKNALLIGFIQCIAMVPGTSRSAATIIGGMLTGASRKTATEFSFFIAIPTMFAASGYSLLKSGFELTRNEWSSLAIGFIVAFIVAFFVVSKFIKYISKHDFKIFGYYRIVIGIIILLIFR